MKAEVKYNNNAERESISVYNNVNDRMAHAEIVGGSAIVTMMEPTNENVVVYGDECVAVLEFLEQLPFVQATKFGDADE